MIITDEILMAYADGELSREDCRRLEAILSQDAGLRARLEPFSVTGSSLANVFDQPMREPIPDRLLAVITAGGRRMPAAGERAARQPQQQTGGIFDAIAEALFPRGLGFASAFSLTALVAAGGVAGYVVGSMGVSPQGAAVVAAGDLENALETQASLSDEVALGTGAALWPAASFKSNSEGFCREYKIVGSDGNGFAGVACRGADSQWRVAVHAELKAPSKEKLADAIVQGTAPKKYWSAGDLRSQAVEDAVDKLKKGDVFGSDEEAAAIANQWKATE
jgi:surface antigen